MFGINSDLSMMKNILIPISFSEASNSALVQAKLIAAHYHSTLTLVHCYSNKEYNRPYDFKGETYTDGIRRMLSEFYQKTIDSKTNLKSKFVTYEGSLADYVESGSHQYDMIILVRKGGANNKGSSMLTHKMLQLTSKSKCPILVGLLGGSHFKMSDIRSIWHIKRRDGESELIKKAMSSYGLSKSQIVEKSLDQKTFKSNFWKKIVALRKNSISSSIHEIAQLFAEEQIDLLVLVYYNTGLFEHFIDDKAVKTLSLLDVPLLIFNNKAFTR